MNPSVWSTFIGKNIVQVENLQKTVPGDETRHVFTRNQIFYRNNIYIYLKKKKNIGRDWSCWEINSMITQRKQITKISKGT